MLFLSTEKTENTIINIEDYFTLRYSDIRMRFANDKNVIRVLKEIDGMKSYSDDVLVAKFGSVPLYQISMGSKACILAILYNQEFIVSTDEIGYNCIALLADLSKNMDIHLYSSCSYWNFPEGISVNLNGNLCNDADELNDLMHYYLRQ